MAILRAGLYERVSSDEQAKYGYSIRAQIEALTEYCEKNKIKIVDHYTDEGVSGGKPINKRPQLMRLINDVKAGKIDIILFTKLDRWSRNTKEFFRAQDILDELKVEWKAIHEDFDTTTPNGRMAITIFLAIAQNEREKGADRVKRVFADKRKRKEAWFGERSMPFGYMKKADEDGVLRLVKNPAVQDAVQDFFSLTLKWNNATRAMKCVNETYGLNRSRKSWYELLKKEIYTGKCHDIENYCEAYVTKEEFAALSECKQIRKTQQNRVYLFTGLLPCPGCGRTMKSSYVISKRKDGTVKEYQGYRCTERYLKGCEYKHHIYEIALERKLLACIDDVVREKINDVETARATQKKKPQNNLKALKEQLRRLEVVYLAGNKSDEDYLAESNAVKKKIQLAEQELEGDLATVDVSKLKAFLESDYKTAYNEMDKEHKQAFWRGLIKAIHLEGKEIKSVDLIF